MLLILFRKSPTTGLHASMVKNTFSQKIYIVPFVSQCLKQFDNGFGLHKTAFTARTKPCRPLL